MSSVAVIPDCIEIGLRLVPVVVAVIVGLIAAYIAWRQYHVAKEKVRLDLFDRRLAVYDALREYFSCVTRNGRADDEGWRWLWKAYVQARFLFGEDVNSAIAEIMEKAKEMDRVSIELRMSDNGGLPRGSTRDAAAKRKQDLLIWHLNRLGTYEVVFDRYLSFANIS